MFVYLDKSNSKLNSLQQNLSRTMVHLQREIQNYLFDNNIAIKLTHKRFVYILMADQTLDVLYGKLYSMISIIMQKISSDAQTLLRAMLQILTTDNALETLSYLQGKLNSLYQKRLFLPIIQQLKFLFKDYKTSFLNDDIEGLKTFLLYTQATKLKLIQKINRCSLNTIINIKQKGLQLVTNQFTILEKNIQNMEKRILKLEDIHGQRLYLIKQDPGDQQQIIKQENQQDSSLIKANQNDSFINHMLPQEPQLNQRNTKAQEYPLNAPGFQLFLASTPMASSLSKKLTKAQNFRKKGKISFSNISEQARQQVSQVMFLSNEFLIDQFVGNNKQNPLPEPRQIIYQELKAIKQKLDKFLPLHKSDQKIFKLCLEHEGKLFKSIMNQDQSQIQKVKQSIQLMKQRLQQMSFNNEQSCFKHRGKVLYICFNDYLKQKIYLCNRCIEEIADDQQHVDHQIHCKLHRLAITHKILYPMDELQEEKLPNSLQAARKYQSLKNQTYLCMQCLQNVINRLDIKYSPISKCHFIPVTSLCIQQSCIKNDSYLICPACQNSSHKGHRMTKLEKSTLMETFEKSQQENIANLQSFFIDIRQRLKLHPIKKLIDSSANNIWNSVSYLNAFVINNNRLVQHWVDSFLEDRNKEDLYVLWSLRELQSRKLGEYQKQLILETISDRCSQQEESLFMNLSELINNFQQKVKQIIGIDLTQAETYLNKKYSTINNFQSHQMIISLPCDLYAISDIHLERVQIIQISKQQQDNQQRVEAQLKKRRKRFYKYQLKRILKSTRLSQEKQTEIQYIFIEQQVLNQSIAEKIKVETKDQQDLEEIKRSLDKYLHEYYNHLKMLEECPPLRFIRQKKMRNLRIINIQYALQQSLTLPFRSQNWKTYVYSISAFDLFRIINTHKQLKQVSLKGVFVQHFQDFVKLYRKYKEKLMTNEDFESQLGQNNFRLINQLISQPNQQSNIFLPPKIALSICGELIFSLKKESIQSKVMDLNDFLSIFEQITDVLVQFNLNFTNKQLSEYEHLLQSIKKMKRIKLVLQGSNQSNAPFSIIFRKLLPLSQIQQITFRSTLSLIIGINFSQLSYQQYVNIQGIIQKIFDNNKFTKLQICDCSKFPKIKNVTTLQSVSITDLKQKFNPRFLSLNQNIKYLRIKQSLKQESEKLLMPLLKHSYNLSFKDNWMDTQILSFVCQWKHMKVLQLTDSASTISQLYLKNIFPRLEGLTHLYLEYLNCTGDTILTIPSNQLVGIKLWSNRIISNKCIQKIDSKWPYLTVVTLRKMQVYLDNCPRVNGRIFAECKFRSLNTLFIEENLLKETRNILPYLKKRGIQVNYT